MVVLGHVLFVVLTFCSCNARQSAPTDGRDASGAIVVASKIALTSKQNSDAKGFFYQWGRKDPFTFATSSEMWGVASHEKGKYPIKIYTIDGVLIYQDGKGDSNKNKRPAGGVIVSLISATSMMETIKNPITFYVSSEVINQYGHTKFLWNYYWTSYSRGVDGNGAWNIIDPHWHDSYLNGYTSKRYKSIFDPCPVGFRMPINGTYSKFTNSSWTNGSSIGGVAWNLGIKSWFPAFGWREIYFSYIGIDGFYFTSISKFNNITYSLIFVNDGKISESAAYAKSSGLSVRCIDFTPRQAYTKKHSSARFIGG